LHLLHCLTAATCRMPPALRTARRLPFLPASGFSRRLVCPSPSACRSSVLPRLPPLMPFCMWISAPASRCARCRRADYHLLLDFAFTSYAFTLCCVSAFSAALLLLRSTGHALHLRGCTLRARVAVLAAGAVTVGSACLPPACGCAIARCCCRFTCLPGSFYRSAPAAVLPSPFGCQCLPFASNLPLTLPPAACPRLPFRCVLPALPPLPLPAGCRFACTSAARLPPPAVQIFLDAGLLRCLPCCVTCL